MPALYKRSAGTVSIAAPPPTPGLPPFLIRENCGEAETESISSCVMPKSGHRRALARARLGVTEAVESGYELIGMMP